jgi:hypothetical protein
MEGRVLFCFEELEASSTTGEPGGMQRKCQRVFKYNRTLLRQLSGSPAFENAGSDLHKTRNWMMEKCP